MCPCTLFTASNCFFLLLLSCSRGPDTELFSPQDTRRSQQAMASRGGATRPNGPNAGTKICQFKLVLLGESAVGKSSLVLRFVKGQFHEFQESTIGGKGHPEKPTLIHELPAGCGSNGSVWWGGVFVSALLLETSADCVRTRLSTSEMG